jgi:hypothetical protein
MERDYAHPGLEELFVINYLVTPSLPDVFLV